MRSGLLKTVQFTDELENRFQANVKAALETLSADDDMVNAPITSYLVTGQIAPGKSLVMFRGNVGQTLSLPPAKAQGDNVGAVVFLGNPTGNAVTVIPTAGDALNGLLTLSVAAGALLVLVSDGVSKWLALAAGSAGGVSDGDKGDVVVTVGGTVWTIDANVVSNTKLAQMAANTIKAEATGALANAQDLAVGANTVVGRVAGNIVAAPLVNAQVDAAAALALSKLANQAANTFVANATGGAAAPTAVTVATALATLGAFAGVSIQAFTASGTYTPTAGMKSCIVLTTGSGGGAGGADATGLGDAAAGAGGGAGGTCIEAFSAATIGASQAVTIGAVGTAGSGTGGTAGGNGGNSTFGALHTANGGTGGPGSGAGAQNVQVLAGGAGGVPTGGTLNIPGGHGDNSFAFLTLDATDTNEIAGASGGQGGASFWGGGGRGGVADQDAAGADSTAETQAGQAGSAFGSGGGGGACLNMATGVAGGAGAAGCCLVIEFT